MSIASLFFSGIAQAARTAAPPKPVSADTEYVCPECGNDCDTVVFHAPGTCPQCGMTLIPRLPAPSTPPVINVALFLFDGVELLDFAGPGEVFASASGFRIYTVASSKQPITSQGFVKVMPDFSLSDCPEPSIIIIPGGAVSAAMADQELISWLQREAGASKTVLSICTGAGILSRAGLLDGLTATTYHGYIDRLQQMTPKATILKDIRFVDNGRIITTAGVSAGIDGALHLLSRLKGEAVAQQTAAYIEYTKWVPKDGLVIH